MSSMKSMFLASVVMCATANFAFAVSIDWTTIGDPNNPAYTLLGKAAGVVPYEYRISTYEVTQSQYAEFLNNKATFGQPGWHIGSGITRSGSGTVSNPYHYIPSAPNYPVTYVSLYDAQSFVNWLNNGQGSADSLNGVYDLIAEKQTPFGANIDFQRNPNATVWLPNTDEWLKAALYDPNKSGGGGYWKYPTSSDTLPGKTLPDPGNSANYNTKAVMPVGSYSNSPSPWGTFDQMGNVSEWLERDPIYQTGGTWTGNLYGGSYFSNLYDYNFGPHSDSHQWDDGVSYIGFRVAGAVPIPEPSTLALAGIGSLALIVAARRRSAR